MKYFVGFLGVVALVILVFILVVRGFSGGGSKAPKTEVTLADYANTSTLMRMTAEEPVTSNQDYNEVRITIGRDANTIEIVQGYEGQVIKAKTYPNNSDAYNTFLRALQQLGYTKGVADPALSDERGHCPTGKVFVYEIVNGGADSQRFWIGTCGEGTFKGSSATIRSLFRKQIPDYDKFVGNVSVAS